MASTSETLPGARANRSRYEISITRFYGVLACLIAAIGIGTIVSTIWLVVRSYSPAFFWDQWEILTPLIQTHDHPRFAQLWAQHNEHRIVIQRLLGFADLHWFNGRSITLLTEIMLVQAVHLALLVWVSRRFGNVTRWELLSLSGFLAYALFSPLQTENFTWGFQVAFVLVGLCASASISSLIEFKRRLSNNQSGNFAFAACIVAAWLAELSNANGILIWPVLSLAAFLLCIPARRQWILALTGACAIALYLIGYHSPGNHSNPLQTIRQPGKLLKFVVTCFGFSFDPTLPNISRWPAVSESLTVVAILFLVALGWFVLRKRGQASLLLTFAVLDGCFYLITTLVVALGRLRFGYIQAITSRYQTFALVFWACMAIALYLLLKDSSWGLKTGFQVGLLVLLLSSVGIGRFQGIWKTAIDRQHSLDAGWRDVERGDYDSPAALVLFSTSAETPRFVEYLVAHHIIPLPVSKRPWSMNIDECEGWLDGATSVGDGNFSVAGWAYDAKKGGAPLKVFVASFTGDTLGEGQSGLPRPDVAAVHKEVNPNTGWQALCHIPQRGVYRAYVRLDEKTVCPLNGVMQVP